MVNQHIPPVRPGRGAPTNASSTRFNLNSRELDGDWLDACQSIDDPAAQLSTTVTEEFPKSILSFNSSPDLPFDRSVNAYRGCEHGCVYCYARPSHAYHDLSPGLDFESRLFAKPNAAMLLRKTMAKKGYRALPIAIGTNTDPYQPIERTYRITREILKLCLETRHPIVITTKSARVLDDKDLLVELSNLGLSSVAISITSLDPKLAARLEPRASTPTKRLEAVRSLVNAGVHVHVNLAPIIPGLTDNEIEHIVAAAAAHGASSISWIPIRLPHELSELFCNWLEVHFPDRAKKVMNIIRDMRGGKDNDPDYFSRMRGQGAWADLIRTRVKIAVRKSQLNNSPWSARNDLFCPPDLDGQLSLF
ncbi:MAG: PA0069 family radical SAM protein [Sphingorhabdus sp.]